MQKVLSQEQLQALSPEDRKALAQKTDVRIKVLETSKKQKPEAFTKEQEDELTALKSICAAIASIEQKAAADAKPKDTEVVATESEYKPTKATEKLVHIEIVSGRRYDPATGKEISKPYVQMFSYGEWQAFKENFTKLGFRILRVLHDPYGEAANYVSE